MSKVDNDSFRTKYNQTITSADMNAKFTDIKVATNNGSPEIDEANVRNEGIDRRNLGETPNLTHLDIEGNEMIDALSTYTFDTIAGSGNPALVRLNQTSGGGASVIDFGSVITINGSTTTPDLLRLHYSFLHDSFGGGGDPLVVGTGDRQFRSVMVIFPAFSTDSTNWSCFPNRTNFFQFNSSGVSASEVGPKRNNTSGAADKYELPYQDTSESVGKDDGCVMWDIATFADVGATKMKYHGCLNFTDTSNLSLRYISFWAVGPLMLSLNSTYGSGRTLEASGLGLSPVKFERAHYAAMVLSPK